MIEPDEKKVLDVLGIHPDRMTSYLKLRRKPIKRLSRWMLVAGVFLAVQTTYSLDAGHHLVVEQTTIEKPSVQSKHGIKHYTATFVFLTSTASGNVWTVPDAWNDSNNKIECIGGGGGSGGCRNTGQSGGAGGGAYSSSSNVNLTPGSGQPYKVGAGGAAGTGVDDDGTTGGDTWFGSASYSSSIVGAKGGAKSNHASSNFSSAGAGGSSSSGRGDVKRSGGNGKSGAGVVNGGGGGGGAGGPNGSGNSATSSTGGTGDAGHGGTANSAGTNMGGGAVGSGGGGSVGSDGGLYGGGAGGQTGQNGFWRAGHAGAKGIIVITYTPLVAPTVTSVSPSTGFTTGGDSITITGSDFTGATGVKFDTTDATDVTVVSSTSITCTNPAHDSGTVDVSVTTAAGTGTLSNAFNYQDTPEPAGVPYIYGI